jgi:hypothetical protein
MDAPAAGVPSILLVWEFERTSLKFSLMLSRRD